jgi:hypothetical protein
MATANQRLADQYANLLGAPLSNRYSLTAAISQNRPLTQ